MYHALQASQPERAHWPWWLAAAVAAVLAAALGWPAPHDERVVLTPSATRALSTLARPVEASSPSSPAIAAEPAPATAAAAIESSPAPAIPPASVRPAAPPEQPAFAEGEAPWDLAPPFRH